jgi:hypothetical protein
MSTTQRDTIRDFLQRHAGQAQTIEDIVKGVSGLNEEQVRGHMERLAGYILEDGQNAQIHRVGQNLYVWADEMIVEIGGTALSVVPFRR